MNEEQIAGLALKDLVDLGNALRKRLKGKDSVQIYWEWLASNALTMGYQVMSSQSGKAEARRWIERVFQSFTALAREQGHDLSIGVLERLE